MSLTVEQSQAFEANVETGITGLTGTIAVAVVDNDGNIVTGPTTANITENVVGTSTGNYTWNNPAAPGTVGQYQILWSTDGTFDPETVSSEDLLVIAAGTSPIPPPIPPPSGGGLSPGPCSSWTDSDAVAACCSIETSDSSIFDDAVVAASELLFELSGRLYAGLCQKTGMRPQCHNCGCGWQVLSRGYVVGPWDYYGGWYWDNMCDFCMVSCKPSRIKLSGYPIREITEIKIDGDVVDPSEYSLYQNRYVTRLNDARWPWSQDLTLPDTEDGTFSVSYTYGQDPPFLGQQAAAQLACEIFKACDSATAGSCALPKGTTKVTRQGVTIEKLAFTNWAFTPARNARGFRSPGWSTGLPLVDAFLSSYNPTGTRRRTVFWSPSQKLRYAQPGP